MKASPQQLASHPLGVALLGAVVGLSAVAVDISLPAIPDITQSFDARPGRAQLVVAFYLMGMACGQILWGSLSDALGRLNTLYIGFGAFLIMAIACVLAQSIEQLLLFRLIQGVCGAVGPVVGRAIVRDISSGVEGARLMSAMTSVIGAAPLLAPFVGSLLVAQWGWNSVFVFTAVFAVICCFGIIAFVPETHQRCHRQALSWRQLGFNNKLLMSNAQCRYGILMVAVPMAGYLLVITQSADVLTERFGLSLTAFGVVFGLSAAAYVLGALVNRRLLARMGIERLMTIGTLMVVCAGIILLFMAFFTVALVPMWICVSLYLAGAGVVMPNATTVALAPYPHIAGSSAATLGFAQIGFGAAVAVLGSAFYTPGHSALCLGMGVMSLLVLILYLRKPALEI